MQFLTAGLPEAIQTRLQLLSTKGSDVLADVAEIQFRKQRTQTMLCLQDTEVEILHHSNHGGGSKDGESSVQVAVLRNLAASVRNYVGLCVANQVLACFDQIFEKLRQSNAFCLQSQRIIGYCRSPVEIVHGSNTVQRVPEKQHLVKLHRIGCRGGWA